MLVYSPKAKQILGGIGERRNISESVRRNLPLPSPQEPSSPPALAPSRESSPLAEEEGKRDCQETNHLCGEGTHPLVFAGSLACRSTRPCPAWSLEQRDSPRCTLRYLSVKREGGLVGEKEFGSTLARSSRPFVSSGAKRCSVMIGIVDTEWIRLSEGMESVSL